MCTLVDIWTKADMLYCRYTCFGGDRKCYIQWAIMPRFQGLGRGLLRIFPFSPQEQPCLVFTHPTIPGGGRVRNAGLPVITSNMLLTVACEYCRQAPSAFGCPRGSRGQPWQGSDSSRGLVIRQPPCSIPRDIVVNRQQKTSNSSPRTQ